MLTTILDELIADLSAVGAALAGLLLLGHILFALATAGS